MNIKIDLPQNMIRTYVIPPSLANLGIRITDYRTVQKPKTQLEFFNTHTHTHTHTNIYTYIYIYIYIYLCVCVRMFICIHIYFSLCMCWYTLLFVDIKTNK